MPYWLDEESDGYNVVINSEPDDADVLLNGRFIGAAYEFATTQSALRLASRNNEITVKKEGFVEENFDLRYFSSHVIHLRVKLYQDKHIVAEPAAAKTAQAAEPAQPAAVPEEAPPAAALPAAKTAAVVQVKLQIAGDANDAAIYLNGKFFGIVPAGGKIENLRLPPGKISVAVFKPGYKTFSREYTLPKQETYEILIRLEKEK